LMVLGEEEVAESVEENATYVIPSGVILTGDVIETSLTELNEGSGERAWRRLVRHVLRLRQLQRVWGYLGQQLQLYPDRLRVRLREVFPTAYQERWGRGPPWRR